MFIHIEKPPGVVRLSPLASCVLACAALSGCGPATQLFAQGTGPRPALPPPNETLLPTVNIPPATGWPQGVAPRAAAGLQVAAFAIGLDHPRWILVLLKGDMLVAETNAPPKPEGSLSVRDRVMALVMQRAGTGTPSANRITLLRDADGDGIAETRSVSLSGLHSPFGMALIGDRLFVANADVVLSFPYRRGDTVINAYGTRLVDLPGGPINHHWTKNLLASSDGSRLYVSVGSNSNVGKRGTSVEKGRAGIWEAKVASGAHRIFASGLRNPMGMAWDDADQRLWAVVSERDELGSDLVPDHGLARSAGGTLPGPCADGIFLGQHGPWNRRPHSGYKAIFVPFPNGVPAGAPLDVLTGFLDEAGNAMGRPAGVAIDARGALLLADDVGNAIWRVSATP